MTNELAEYFGAPGAGEALTLEIVWSEPTSLEALTGQIDEAVSGADFTLEHAVSEEEEQFFFATFPDVAGSVTPATGFEIAHALKRALGALEVNPILEESLYGAISAGAMQEDAEGAFASFCETPRSTDLPFGWPHVQIKSHEAWAKSRGAGTTIAVIDTGYSTHIELDGAVSATGHANFVEGGTDSRDRFSDGILRHPGHGTTVASVVASRGTVDGHGNTGGHGSVTGAAPEATVLPIRAIKSVINPTQRTLPRAIAHAINQGADAIIMAQGGPFRVASTERILRIARDRGLLVCCAAGNCYPRTVYPAAYAPLGLTTAVAALAYDERPWAKSGRGPEVTISAPGENVWAAAKRAESDPDYGITPAQGTTLATSLTVGVAACWIAAHGGRDALRAKAAAAGTSVQELWNAAVTHGISKPDVWNGAHNLGAGKLDAGKALAAPLALGDEAPEAPAAPLSAAGVATPLNLLLDHLAYHAPEAAGEVDAALEDYAGELIWLSHQRAAGLRAQEGLETPLPPPAASQGLQSVLAGKPALTAEIGL